MTGNGISSIRKTGTSGLVDTYTITYTNGNTTTFTVTNGEDGEVTETELDVLRQNDTELKNDISKNADEITNLKNENAYLQNVVKQAFTETSASGTELTIDNTIEARMEMKLNGNTSQNGEPTPSSPVDVNVVSGSNVISTSNKNLFNAQIQAGTYNQIIYSVARDGLITQSASDNSGWDKAQTRNFYLDAGTYTINCIGKGTEKRLQVRNLTDNVDVIETQSEKATFTLTERKLLAIKTWGSSRYPVSYYVQIEKGSEATTYEPHQEGKEFPLDLGNIELCKIGDYQDYFKKENGKWYKVEKIKSIIVDGTNYLCIYMFPNGTFVIYSNAEKKTIRDALKSSSLSLFSNYLISKTYTAVFYNGEIGASYNDRTGEIVANIGISTNKEDINTWLTTHNLMIKYILQTPNKIEITDTTLINQLDEISQALSKKGTTIISQNNDDLPFYLDVIALTK